MNTQVNAPSFFRNSLRISTAILLVVGASFAIPKIADAAETLKHMVPKDSTPVVKRSRSSGQKANPQDSLNGGYKPPNFGRPASAYGSGTR